MFKSIAAQPRPDIHCEVQSLISGSSQKTGLLNTVKVNS